MSSFAGITLDADVQENTGGFTILPAGKYKACLVSDELKENRAGKMIRCRILWLSGGCQGLIYLAQSATRWTQNKTTSVPVIGEMVPFLNRS